MEQTTFGRNDGLRRDMPLRLAARVCKERLGERWRICKDEVVLTVSIHPVANAAKLRIAGCVLSDQLEALFFIASHSPSHVMQRT